MNQEIAMLRGLLSELKRKKMELETRVAANLRAVKLSLAALELRPLRELDITGMAAIMRGAEMLMAELNGVYDDIAKAEKELA